MSPQEQAEARKRAEGKGREGKGREGKPSEGRRYKPPLHQAKATTATKEKNHNSSHKQ